MASSKQFLVFSDIYCFLGFITQLIYILIPIAFLFQLYHKVLKRERISCIGIFCLYMNAFIYFFLSFYKRKEGEEIDPLDLCNMSGAYLGFIYIVFYIYLLHFRTNKKLCFILMISFALISCTIFLIIKFTIDDNKDNIFTSLFNWIGVFFNVFENLPIGFNIIYLIKNKISEKFTLFGAFFGLINEITWLAWAIHAIFTGANLIHSVVANILGISIHCTQFFLFFKFREYEIEEDDAEEKNDNKINLSNNSDNKNEKQNNNNINLGLFDIQENKEPDYIKDFL